MNLFLNDSFHYDTCAGIIIIEPFTETKFYPHNYRHLPTSSSISVILQQNQVQMNF
jgi:hypothetical protein